MHTNCETLCVQWAAFLRSCCQCIGGGREGKGGQGRGWGWGWGKEWRVEWGGRGWVGGGRRKIGGGKGRGRWEGGRQEGGGYNCLHTGNTDSSSAWQRLKREFHGRFN